MKSIKNILNDVMKYGIHSLLVKYFICIALTVMVPAVVISSSVCFFYNNLTVEETVSEKKENLEMKKNMTELLFENVMITIQEISRNQSTLEYIKNGAGKLSAYDLYELAGTLSKNIGKSIAANDLISDVSVYSAQGKGVFRLAGGIVSNSELEERIFRSNTFDLSIESYKDEYGSYILIYNRVRDEMNNPVGLITMYIHVANVKSYLIDYAQYNNDLYIADNNGKILFAMEESAIGNNIESLFFYDDCIKSSTQNVYDCKVEDESYTIIKTFADYNSRSYISVVSNNEYLQKTASILNFILIALIITLILSLVVAFVLSMRMYMPIYELMSSIEKKDRLTVDMVRDAKENEILYIMSHLDLSAKEAENLKNQLDEKMKLLNRANSKVLQMQINPHFMYNALEAVNWKVISVVGVENEASEMINSLAYMMRYALETEHSVVSVNKEIENVKAYLRFQKIRFKDRIEISCDIPDSIGQYSIIKLSLQPIIENTFSHGIKGLKGIGIVSVSAVEEEEQIRFEIKDNGVGIDNDKAALIIERLKSDYVMSENQIGIANVNQRIKLIFGEDYGVKLASYEPGNTIFNVTIPKVKQK